MSSTPTQRDDQDPTHDFTQVFKRELEVIGRRKLTDDANDLNAPARHVGLPDFAAHSGEKPYGEVFEKIVDELHANQSAWDAWIAAGEETSGNTPEANNPADDKGKTWTRAERKAASGLTGLALSGGGIRSATFNLGVVQLLKRCGLFKCFDYLSTVSGGGYLGACLSSSLATGNKRLFEHRPGEPESLVFRHLRNNARYLAPDGFMDYLRIPAVLLRGILVNLLALGSAVAVLAAGYAECLRWFQVNMATPGAAAPRWWLVAAGFGGLFALGTILYVFLSDKFADWLERNECGFKARNISEAIFTWVLLGAIVSALVMLQPRILAWLPRGNLLQWLAGAGASLAGFGAFADKLGLSLEKFYHKAGMTAALLSGAIVLYLAFAYSTLTIVEHGATWSAWTAGIGIFTALFLLFGWNINLTGMHNFYRDRLSCAYVVAEEGSMAPSANGPMRLDATDLYADAKIIHNDCLKLSDLAETTGPYHIVNTAINLRQQTEKFQKGRKADNFIFSPLHVGAPIVGYCETKELEKQNAHVNLATAMAVSGAAAAPNMGRATNRFVAIILTMFNIRLNYWLRSPRTVCLGGTKGLRRLTDRGLVQFAWEVLGLLKPTDRLVNLSDGGHFDNSGLYELLRRECRFIILGDGECDREFRFEALAEVTRMALIDFGITILFDGLDEIREGQRSYAVGTIYYTKNRIGKLLYLKSNLSGDYNLESTLSETAYVSSPLRDDNRFYNRSTYIANYRAAHPEFPHESTSDQFFDEVQFECYRALGYEVASRALVRPSA